MCVNCTYVHVPEGAAAAAATSQRMSVSTRPTVARREAELPFPAERAADEVLGFGRVLVWVLGEDRLEREPWGGAGARDRPRRAVRLLSLPVFFRSMLAGVGRPPLRCSDCNRWYCSCSCRCLRRSSKWRASRFSCRCLGGGVGGGPLVLSGRWGAAPSWELTLSVLLLLEDSWPALALLVELLVEAEEAVESSLKEPRPNGGLCLSTGPYSSRPSAFLSTPPTMVATTPPGGKDTALPAGPIGDVGDSMGERDEVRGGGGGGRRCCSPCCPMACASCVSPSTWRGSSRGAGAGFELAARGSVLAAPG